jgi:hypoxanthine phosphoribosyltransferase
MRTFLREQTTNKTLQIQAIGLSLYEPVEGSTAEQIGHEVVRTQWLGPDPGKQLLGKKILIVDEVDDTRKTLHYAVSELKKDIEAELETRPESERDALRNATSFGIFVVHNKLKPKLAELPAGTPYAVSFSIPYSPFLNPGSSLFLSSAESDTSLVQTSETCGWITHGR